MGRDRPDERRPGQEAADFGLAAFAAQDGASEGGGPDWRGRRSTSTTTPTWHRLGLVHHRVVGQPRSGELGTIAGSTASRCRKRRDRVWNTVDPRRVTVREGSHPAGPATSTSSRGRGAFGTTSTDGVAGARLPSRTTARSRRPSRTRFRSEVIPTLRSFLCRRRIWRSDDGVGSPKLRVKDGGGVGG